MMGGLKGNIATAVAAILAIVGAAHAADLKLGVVGTLSGGGTEWGVATQRGVELAIAEVTAAGGLKVGKQTYTPKMIIYDDQYTAQGGTTAATRLVNVDGVKYIIGPIGSPAVLGVLGVARPQHVVVLSDGFSPKILTPDSNYNFRISLTTTEFAPPIAKWVREKFPQAKRVGIISPNDAVGQSIVPILIAAYRQQGFELTFDEKYERGMMDFTPLITRMMAKGVDIFDLDSNAPGEAGLLVKQARQLGFKGTIIQTGGPGIDAVIKVSGPLSNGFLSYDIFDPAAQSATEFVKAYRAKYQGPIDAYAPIMYNATKLLFEAMRRAGSLDVDAVRVQLEKLEGYSTLFGPVRWGGKQTYGINHQLLTEFYVTEVKDGRPQTITRLKP
jgi:branched-chain amino acid transport system substrate-binding protein